jgi:acyl-CoA thioesterase FadM
MTDTPSDAAGADSGAPGSSIEAGVEAGRPGRVSDLADPARIVLPRRIEWMDTDAAGIYHYTTVFRLAEAAEAELHTGLGIDHVTFGATPRLDVSAAFRRSLGFNDLVDVHLEVASIGRASLEYRFRISTEGQIAAEGKILLCYIDRASGRAAPWPDEVRSRLAAGGLVQPRP